MHFLRKIKLKLRLAFLFVVLIAAVGSSISYLKIKQSKTFISYNEQVKAILLHLKEARLQEKNFIIYDRKSEDFLKDGQSETITIHQNEISQIYMIIDSLNKHIAEEDFMLLAKLAELKEAVKEYNNYNDELRELYFKRGFKDYGLEGSMRGNVHDLQQATSLQEQVFAYSLRRHEKDFMLRKDLKYFYNLKHTAEQFKDYVRAGNAAHMNADYKRTIIRVIDAYIDKFKQLVEIEIAIGLTVADGISGKLSASAESLLPISIDLYDYAEAKNIKLQKEANIYLIVSIVLMGLAGFLIVNRLDRTISRPVSLLNDVIKDEIEGKRNSGVLNQIKNKDEIGELTNNFKLMMEKLDDQMHEITENNKVLEAASEEDRKRKWVAEGVSGFVDMMKNGSNNMEQMSYDIISGLTKYIGANQGGIFYVNDIEDATAMNLAASFAYDRRKYMQKTIHKGEGLIGAVWKEKETSVIDAVPKDYITITSGLGYALPDKLIIHPIMAEDKVFGVVEIASFKPFEAHHIELISKTCHRLATNYESIQIQEKTIHLLQISQIQGEELKAQEEEMRQNLEEMAATQEDYTRRENELNELVEYLKQSIRKLEAKCKELDQNVCVN